LAALQALHLLDTAAEPRFDRLTRIAQHHFGVAITLVSLVDVERQWFKSRQGLDVCETHRDVSFCGHAILSEDVLCIPDAREDPRFADNPLVTGAPYIRFYAGAPVHAPNGQRIGTLCLIDPVPRALSPPDRALLRDLAACVDEEIGKTRLIEQAQALARAQRLEEIITDTQSAFLAAEDSQTALVGLLRDLLALTDSAAGFLAEVASADQGNAAAEPCAVTVLAWDPTTGRFSTPQPGRDMALTALIDLFGAALAQGESVIVEPARGDPRLPALFGTGAPPNAVLALPVLVGEDLVAVVGLANRPQSDASALATFLRPLIATLGQLIHAGRLRARQQVAERRLRAVIDATRVGTWEWDIQTGTLVCNARWAEILGYTLAELAALTRETWRRLTHPDDLAVAEARLQRYLHGDQPSYECEYRLRHKGGHWIWVRARGGIVSRSEAGTPQLMAGTHADVTDRKIAQLQLEASQARLRGLFDLSPVGIALSDDETGAFIDVNDALLDSTGYQRAEFLALHTSDLTPSAFAAEERRHLAMLQHTGRYEQYEKDVLGKDGKRYPALVSAMTVHDGVGRKLTWSIMQDISAQQALMRHAEQQRDDLHALLDQLKIGTLLLDSAGRVGFVSRYCGALGLDCHTAVGQHWRDVLPVDADAERRLAAQLTAGAEARQRLDLSWRRAERDYAVQCDVRDTQRELGGQLLCLTDVTELRRLQQELDVSRYGQMLGASGTMRELFRLIDDVARGDWTVLIEGETGTGKELVAHSIHEASPRKKGPFIALNAAGLSETLLASQLFGHRKGAFTGAFADQEGFFEAANGGTLFLDEIGDLPLGMQASLLRVLQEREILRVGETRPRKVDVRIVAATHKDLAREVQEGRFRQDLLYRLRVARIDVPALRQRTADIPLLAESFLGQSAPVSSRPRPRLSPEAIGCLLQYDWPGNVRELKTAIDYAVIHCRGEHLAPADFPPEIGRAPIPMSRRAEPERLAPEPLPEEGDERSRLLAALKHARGNRTAAAKLLGISRATFYRHLTQLDIDPSQ
jgi:PAS domain S-box-containing protein